MTPTRASELLEQWAKNAKTDESRMVCEMAAIGMRNSAMCREILETSGKHQLTIQYFRDSDGKEMFVVWSHGGSTIVAETLSDALIGLREKTAPKAAT